jgi:hypothetical protein
LAKGEQKVSESVKINRSLLVWLCWLLAVKQEKRNNLAAVEKEFKALNLGLFTFSRRP